MKLIEITNQHRRDFDGDFKCEFCGRKEHITGNYDDQYYHVNVIPNMKCKKCGKSTISEGGKIDKFTTKYPEGFQI
jgi:hypothetical protein